MITKEPLWNRMLRKISRSDDRVFLYKDFSRISKDSRQLRRGIKRLTDEGYLIHFGYGLYAKASRSSLTGNIIPVASLPELGREALKKLGQEVVPTRLEKDYAAGKHNQVPTGQVVAVKGRFSRKIGLNDHYLEVQRAPAAFA